MIEPICRLMMITHEIYNNMIAHYYIFDAGKIDVFCIVLYIDGMEHL